MHFRFAENYITQLTHDIGNVQVCMRAFIAHGHPYHTYICLPAVRDWNKGISIA